jgi:hypothetical protein
MVHGDYSGAAFFTAPSCLPPAILPLHCTREPLAGYRSSPPGKPWPLTTPCFQVFSGVLEIRFKVFQLDIAYVAMTIYAYCKYMFQLF